ncbi:MAG: glycosyltransferase family 77 protein [Simkaniaceae bacterium]|nr:glycosyltransferase family 77 protein [Simkaniaceae bacterium]
MKKGIMLLSLWTSICFSESYKLYSFLTPIYEPIYRDFFLPSLEKEPLIELHLHEIGQISTSGMNGSPGFRETVWNKLEMLEKAILDAQDGEIIFYSDIDIVFLKPFVRETLRHLAEHDFVVQQGWPAKSACSGFFALRCNKTTEQFIQRALRHAKEQKINDQPAIRHTLTHAKDLTWKFLPIANFPNGAYAMQKRHLYAPGALVRLNDQALIFHANWCKNLQYKYHFINEVLKCVSY